LSTAEYLQNINQAVDFRGESSLLVPSRVNDFGEVDSKKPCRFTLVIIDIFLAAAPFTLQG